MQRQPPVVSPAQTADLMRHLERLTRVRGGHLSKNTKEDAAIDKALAHFRLDLVNSHARSLAASR